MSIVTVSGDNITQIPNLSTTPTSNTMYIDDTFPYIASFIGYPALTTGLPTSSPPSCGIYLTNDDDDAYTAISTITINSVSDLPIVIYITSSGGNGADSPHDYTGEQSLVEIYGPGGGGSPAYTNAYEITSGTATPPYSITCNFKLFNTNTTTYTASSYCNSVTFLITIGFTQYSLGAPYVIPANLDLSSLNGSQGTDTGTPGPGGYQSYQAVVDPYIGDVNISSYYLTSPTTTSILELTYQGGGTNNSTMSTGYLLNITGLYSSVGMTSSGSLYISSGGAVGTASSYDSSADVNDYTFGTSYYGGPNSADTTISDIIPGGGTGGYGETSSGTTPSSANGGNATFYGGGGGGAQSSISPSNANYGGYGAAGFALILMPISSTS